MQRHSSFLYPCVKYEQSVVCAHNTAQSSTLLFALADEDRVIPCRHAAEEHHLTEGETFGPLQADAHGRPKQPRRLALYSLELARPFHLNIVRALNPIDKHIEGQWGRRRVRHPLHDVKGEAR
eukprot:5927628-Prymnesium_polylepis.1